MPRELTEQEKKYEHKNLLESGKRLLLQFGIRRVSVSDIAKEAGVAKGTFYNYFESKDDFIFEFIYQLHDDMFQIFEEGLKNFSDLPKESHRETLKNLFIRFMSTPEVAFFIIDYDEMNNFLPRYSKDALNRVEDLERRKYMELLTMVGIKNKDVSILQNYIHIIIFGSSRKEFLNEETIEQTLVIMFSALLDYLEV